MRGAIRSLLILGRVSNLPTVWSNCLVGWTLAAGHPGFSHELLLLCAGCSLLYIAGMYLNDACDVVFDTAHRPERPVPAGTISRRAVTLLGIGWMAAGTVLLLWVAPDSAVWIAALVALIVVYDVVHKRFAAAPVLMAGCRVLIYPLAAAVAAAQSEFIPSPQARLWVASVLMGVWILSLSIIARTESKSGRASSFALLLLAFPFLLCLTASGHAWLPALLLAAWIAYGLFRLRRTGRVGPLVGDLLAAIPLVDLLAVAPKPGLNYVPYLAFMLLALLLRRTIPPT